MKVTSFHKDREVLAKAFCKYANKQFTILGNYPLEVQVNEETKYDYNYWILVIDDYAKQWSKSVEQISAASGDFEAGFKAHEQL